MMSVAADGAYTEFEERVYKYGITECSLFLYGDSNRSVT